MPLSGQHLFHVFRLQTFRHFYIFCHTPNCFFYFLFFRPAEFFLFFPAVSFFHIHPPLFYSSSSSILRILPSARLFLDRTVAAFIFNIPPISSLLYPPNTEKETISLSSSSSSEKASLTSWSRSYLRAKSGSESFAFPFLSPS